MATVNLMTSVVHHIGMETAKLIDERNGRPLIWTRIVQVA